MVADTRNSVVRLQRRLLMLLCAGKGWNLCTDAHSASAEKGSKFSPLRDFADSCDPNQSEFRLACFGRAGKVDLEMHRPVVVTIWIDEHLFHAPPPPTAVVNVRVAGVACLGIESKTSAL